MVEIFGSDHASEDFKERLAQHQRRKVTRTQRIADRKKQQENKALADLVAIPALNSDATIRECNRMLLNSVGNMDTQQQLLDLITRSLVGLNITRRFLYSVERIRRSAFSQISRTQHSQTMPRCHRR